MAGKSTISLSFMFEDSGGGLKKVTMDVKELQRVLNSSVVEVDKLSKGFINFAAFSTSLDSVSSVLTDLQSKVKEFSDAYAVQEEAETKLAQVMRNTMDAREEDIQSIKDFCSAQQQIGVIGDEVQLQGAQELATYLEMKSSLKALIPVMNDMLAQQYGLAASGENASQIATMLGKVMEGQTGALSRYGYKFDDAQEKVLKYGTEMERVAVLVDVVSDSVGGMNRQLAQTDSGKIKQVENNLGDMKEQLGKIVQGSQVFLTMGANATIALLGVTKLITGIKTLIVWLKAMNLASGVAGVAILALTTVIGYFINESVKGEDAANCLATAEDNARRSSEMAAEAAEAESDARKSAVASLEANIAKLKAFNGNKTDEKKLVKELNDTYGKTMGYFSSVSEWYNALIKNSKAYCKQLVAEAKARKLADQIAELELDRDRIIQNEDGSTKKYSPKRETERVWDPHNEYDAAGNANFRFTSVKEKPGSSQLEIAQADYDDKTARIKNLRKKIDDVNKDLSGIKMPVIGAAKAPDLNENKTTTRLQQVNKLLDQYAQKYVTASESEKKAIHLKVEALRKEKQAIESAKSELERPVEFKSIQDFDREISYQQKLRSNATKDQISAIDDTIESLKRQRTEFERSGSSELTTLKDYEEELSYLQELRRTASKEQLGQIDASIKAIEAERDAFVRSSHVAVPVEKSRTTGILKRKLHITQIY